MYTQVCPNSLNFPTSESAKGSLLTKRQINVRFSFYVSGRTKDKVRNIADEVHFPTLGGHRTLFAFCDVTQISGRGRDAEGRREDVTLTFQCKWTN